MDVAMAMYIACGPFGIDITGCASLWSEIVGKWVRVHACLKIDPCLW